MNAMKIRFIGSEKSRLLQMMCEDILRMKNKSSTKS